MLPFEILTVGFWRNHLTHSGPFMMTPKITDPYVCNDCGRDKALTPNDARDHSKCQKWIDVFDSNKTAECFNYLGSNPRKIGLRSKTSSQNSDIDMVEKVARAMFVSNEMGDPDRKTSPDGDPAWKTFERISRAAVQAMNRDRQSNLDDCTSPSRQYVDMLKEEIEAQRVRISELEYGISDIEKAAKFAGSFLTSKDKTAFSIIEKASRRLLGGQKGLRP